MKAVLDGQTEVALIAEKAAPAHHCDDNGEATHTGHTRTNSQFRRNQNCRTIISSERADFTRQ